MDGVCGWFGSQPKKFYKQDAEFDSYWEYEAKNKNRNRIRVGRQYQATIPPLLKPGDKDGRRSEDLETLKWKPDHLNDSELERYLSMARAVTSFSRAIKKCRDPEQTDDSSFQAAIKGLTDFVTSHHPCHHDVGCKVPASIPAVSGECSSSLSSSKSPSPTNAAGDWTAAEAHLFAQAVEACGKNFCAIKKEYLPWKPVRSLIEYYYHYGKVDKAESPPLAPPLPSKVPSPSSCKQEKDEEPVASCSYDRDGDPAVADCPKTKEEPVAPEAEVKKEEACSSSEVPAAAPADPAVSVVMKSPKQEEEPKQAEEEVEEFGPPQSTVGSLKFFLGGRLVLKLNAQQDSVSGTRCQWVQSNDTPKHPYQVKKLKHKKKVTPETGQQNASDSPTHRKKTEEESATLSAESSPAPKRAKTVPFGSDVEYPPLCSASWTPPVADGQESVELDDASSKTSEGCVSPVVFGPRGPKAEVRTETPADHKQKTVDQADIQDSAHGWAKSEPAAAASVPCNSQSDSSYSEDCLPHNYGFVPETTSPKCHGEESTCTLEVLNHKSALHYTKSAAFFARAAHSSSPSGQLFDRRLSPCIELSEKAKSSPSGFQSPNSVASSSISVLDGSARAESVLDLSSRPDQCKSKEVSSNLQPFSHISPAKCVESYSSSEGSPHVSSLAETSSSIPVCCRSSSCKSSTCVACRSAKQQVPTTLEGKDCKAKTCRKKLNVNQLPDANGSAACAEKCCTGQDVATESCDRCSCCSSSSCPSPKCSKNYSSQDQVCNKEGPTSRSPSQNNFCVPAANEDAYHQKLIPWFGAAAAPPMFQFYPHCYPYYMAYSVNPTSVPDSSSAEAPLDLSSNSNSKREKNSRENVPDVQADVPKSAAEAVDRGMLYQLLKSKVTK